MYSFSLIQLETNLELQLCELQWRTYFDFTYIWTFFSIKVKNIHLLCGVLNIPIRSTLKRFLTRRDFSTAKRLHRECVECARQKNCELVQSKLAHWGAANSAARTPLAEALSRANRVLPKLANTQHMHSIYSQEQERALWGLAISTTQFATLPSPPT